MKEHPIIFSGPMVQALLNTKPGSWPAEPLDPSKPFKSMTRRVCHIIGINDRVMSNLIKNGCTDDVVHAYAPHKPGCHLWVRETFTKDPNGEYIYRADPMFDDCGKGDISWAWTSPLFLPREAARIKLEVKNVRIGRVQDIDEKDARAEGIKGKYMGYSIDLLSGGIFHEYDNVEQFMDLWDTLNTKRGYSWERNPWVWVIEFMRIK